MRAALALAAARDFFMKKPAVREAPPEGPSVVLGLLDGAPLRHRSREPVLVVGASGCGKTSGILLTTAAELVCSAFFFDFKGELAEKIPGLREGKGPVAVVRFHRRGGPRWNPLAEIRQGDDFEADCRRVAMILSEREDGKRDHWDDAGVNYMAGVIAHILLSGTDKTLRGVRKHILRRDEGAREMIQHGAHEMVGDAGRAVFRYVPPAERKDAAGKAEDWSDRSYTGRNAATGKRVHRDGRDIDGGDGGDEDEKRSGYRDSIYSTCETHLAPVESRVLADQTSASDFSFSDLMALDDPMTLILSARPRDLKNWRKMYKLFMVMMMDALMDHEDFVADGREKKHDALIAIDEFLQFNFPDIEEWVCYARSFRLRMMLLAQGIGSVRERCGAAVSQSGTRLIFRPRALEEAQVIEQMMGKEHIESPTRTLSRKGPLDTPTVSEGTRIDQRPRHETLEILGMDPDLIWVVGLRHMYLLDTPKPWKHPPWAAYWKTRVGPGSKPWKPTTTKFPWTSLPPAPSAPAAPKGRRSIVGEMPI